MADTITLDYPSSTASQFDYSLDGVSYSFIVLYNNYSNELELICNTASGSQVFRRNLIDGFNMLAGYFTSKTMIYYADESSDISVIIKVA